MRMMMTTALAAGLLIAAAAAAQHEQHSAPHGSSPAGTMSGGMACQMMSGEMSCPHQEMKTLVGELVTSFEAIRGEQDPAALKSKLAAHEALLKQLQAKSQEKCPMMEMMGQQMTHPMGSGQGK
jgi:hypothetical protein